MSSNGLATRCPVCSTVFRVVPDQLRVSEGWVRCGRCSEVFNASLSLVDMDTGAPRAAPEGLPGAAPAPSSAPAHGERLGYDTPSRPSPAVVRYGGARPAAAAPPAQRSLRDEPAPDAGAARPVAQSSVNAWPAPVGFNDRATDRANNSTNDAVAPVNVKTPAPYSDPRAEPDDRPAFVQQADRAARWQRPRVRRALGGALAGAALVLLLQVVYQYREMVAAGWPASRAALQQTCALLGCRVPAAHAIDSLSVESSGLLRVEKSNTYSLSVGLRNRSTFEVTLPALELSLTDNQGRLLARRVIKITELGSPQNTLAASSDVALQATLLVAATAGNEPVAGYTIELFYP